MEAAPQVSNEAAGQPAVHNPHVLWRQVLGLVLWIGVVSFYVQGPGAVIYTLALGGTTFADAWVSGIYKHTNGSSFMNISPMAWGIVVGLLFIVGYPLYLLNRNALRTIRGTNGFFVGTIVLGGLAIVVLILRILGVITIARS